MIRVGFDRLWLVLALALPALLALLVPLPTVDLAYQVRAGAGILDTGRLPAADTWTFTIAGQPWTDQQWLAQVVLAAVHRIGGWELLAVVRAALVAGIVGGAIAVARVRGAGPRVAAGLGLVAFLLAAPALALRPQLLAIALFVAALWAVSSRERQPALLVLVPVLAAAWANVHGSFVLAPLVAGWALLDDVACGRSARRGAMLLAATAAATLVNPFGIGAWQYAAGIGLDPEIASRATEWQRTTPFSVPGALFYVSALVAVALAAVARRALSVADWLWLAGMLVLGAWTVRGLAWWPFGAIPVVAAVLAAPAAAAHVARPRSALNTVVVGVLALGVVAALPWWRPADSLTGRAGLLSYAPSGLAAALGDRATPDDRVIAPQAWTSWFEWAAPAPRYFLDSRFELFPSTVWRDNDAITEGGPAREEVLDRLAATLLVIATGTDGPAGWREVYRDGDGALLERAP